jgi:hypothetical protein
MANLPTYSWFGYAYNEGSVDQRAAPAMYFAASWWPFWGGSQSPNNAAVLGQWFPPLPSCTDTGGNCQLALGPRDMLWNAKSDLASQLVCPSACYSAAQQNVLKYFPGGDIYGKAMTPASLVAYLQTHITFYNGAKSQALVRWLKCPEGNNRKILGCPDAVGTVQDAMADKGQTTAMTVSPSHPFKSFWQPIYTPPPPTTGPGAQPQWDGFGDGVDPSNSGMNIHNEANLFHEALHGMTGLYDDEIITGLGLSGTVTSNGQSYYVGSTIISMWIKDHVLSSCPIAGRPGN